MPPKITIASYVTISRFFLVPLFLYLFLRERYAAALIVAAIAGFTDLLDGFLARHFNMRSRLGSFLDPMADKYLMVLSFLVLAWKERIPLLLTAIVLGKDLIVSLGVMILNLMKIRLYYRPTILSKATTGSQILVLIIAFLEVYLENNSLPMAASLKHFIAATKTGLIYTTAVLTLSTAAQYIFIGYKFYRFGERKE